MLPWQKMAKPLEGRVVVAHVGCCVFLCFGFYVVFDKIDIGKSKNGGLLCNQNIKSTTKPPQCYDMSFTEMVHRKITASHLDMKLVV